MFTGIVQNFGHIKSIDKNGDWRVVIETDMDLSRTPMGASICCSGCCLTVVDMGANWFAVDVSAESLSKTAIGGWQSGSQINLEPSLKLGDELGGHFVFGHVDGLATLISAEKEGDSHRLRMKAPDDLARFIAPKGSVSLDGVSLTVNDVDGDVFGVNIIAHTWENTTLSHKQAGEQLNIEIDMLARYVARQMSVSKDAA